MFEKQAILTKKNIDLFNKFSLIFREKSMQNRCKIMSNDYSHKNQQKNTFGTWFLSEKSILNAFWESLRVPGKVQKGRATLGKTAPWRDLVQFCSFASIAFAAGSISTPFGHHFNTILTPFCLLSGTIFHTALAQKRLPTGSAAWLRRIGWPWKLPCVRSKIFAERCLRQWWYPQYQWSSGMREAFWIKTTVMGV